ncbi:DUF4179 domain-containing protein [Paenibacillus puerhi]|uniref:DUF4179 domain-containing protein n=1 Tax=Paenibacillus puerhi TaxID=2692622 RepID=UPI0013588EDE|nr:DUF4179 domain-containing protein [Paenibacillus puerhi]
MNNQQERYLEKLARQERPELPDFDAMWQSIQERVAAEGGNGPRRRREGDALRSGRRRARLLPVAVAVSTLLVAAPVVAGVTVGWPELFGRLGVSTAFNEGFGNPLDITMESKGVQVSLHGVVTDEKRLDVLFTAMVPDMPKFDVVSFGKASLADSKGASEELRNMIKLDEASGQLTGLLETDNSLSWGRNKLDLTLEGLSFYRYKDTPLPMKLSQLQQGQDIPTGTAYEAIRIQSVERQEETVSIRYELPIRSKEESWAHPHLFLMAGEQRISSSYGAVLPTDKENTQLSQVNFTVTAEQWEQAALQFSYLEPIKTIDGSWLASFDVNDAKARQATYRKKLDIPVAEDFTMKLKAMAVTPLQIKIDYDDEHKLPNHAEYYYRNIKLQVGGQTVEGGRWHDDKTGWYLRFESPEWNKDWSGIPMKLMFTDLQVRKRSTDLWVPLQQVTETPQSFETKLDGFPVTFTYYKQGDDLIVESESTDERFQGISQTAVDQDGERIYPPVEPMPPGGSISNHRVQKYPGLLANHGEIKLSPGFYNYIVPGHAKEISIN